MTHHDDDRHQLIPNQARAPREDDQATPQPMSEPADCGHAEHQSHPITGARVGSVSPSGHDGTTWEPCNAPVPPRDPNAWPTPEQFVSDWERSSHADRLEYAERIIGAAQGVEQVEQLRAERDHNAWACRGNQELLRKAEDRAQAAEARLASVADLVDKLEQTATEASDVVNARTIVDVFRKALTGGGR